MGGLLKGEGCQTFEIRREISLDKIDSKGFFHRITKVESVIDENIISFYFISGGRLAKIENQFCSLVI